MFTCEQSFARKLIIECYFINEYIEEEKEEKREFLYRESWCRRNLFGGRVLKFSRGTTKSYFLLCRKNSEGLTILRYLQRKAFLFLSLSQVRPVFNIHTATPLLSYLRAGFLSACESEAEARLQLWERDIVTAPDNREYSYSFAAR